VGRFKAELIIWHEQRTGFWCRLKLHTQFKLRKMTPSQQRKDRFGGLWRHHLQTKTTVGENRKDSYDYNFGHLRLQVGSFMPLPSATSKLFGSCRHNTHTSQRKGSHYWPTLHCTLQLIQTWRLQAISLLDHRGLKAYTYATFIEARMVAALGAPRHSTNNRISFLDQDARGWNCIRLHSLQNGYCLSTTNR